MAVNAVDKLQYLSFISLTAAVGSLLVPARPRFGDHLEQRIYNEDNNK